MPIRLNRRDVFRGVTSLGAAATAGIFIRSGTARAFGEVPAGYENAMLPEDLRVKSILEVFLFGGVSQYESFYTVESHGQSDGSGWYLHLQSGELDTALTDCNYPANEALTEEFHQDEEGVSVALGPFALPLRLRGDLLDRLRICVTAHEALPHEVAVPLAFTGRRLGHPRMAGLGTHIQRYFMERDGSGPPSSYVILPSDAVVAELSGAAFATGAHSAAAQPVPLLIDQAAQLLSLVRRDTVGERRAAHDMLVQANVDRLRARLRWQAQGDALRSRAFHDSEAAARAVANSAELEAILDPDLLVPVPGQRCDTTTEIDTTAMSMRLAAHLVTHPTTPARYVSVVDGGFVPTGEAGGYDTHRINCDRQARNVAHVLDALVAVLNMPGENDPEKINLDETLVIINTEFGRTPNGENIDENGRWGRGHWPSGFPVMCLGGPITTQNRGIFGATDGGEKAIKSLGPQEHRIAALLALGIWPFDTESYNVGDAVDTSGEDAATTSVLSRVFGVG
jgi:uncharacterized protein DUF1501